MAILVSLTASDVGQSNAYDISAAQAFVTSNTQQAAIHQLLCRPHPACSPGSSRMTKVQTDNYHIEVLVSPVNVRWIQSKHPERDLTLRNRKPPTVADAGFGKPEYPHSGLSLAVANLPRRRRTASARLISFPNCQQLEDVSRLPRL